MAGFLGVAISIIAYLPQIIHLIRERCSAGISAMAYGMWLLASVLITFHAIVIGDLVFTVLGSVQILASLLICLFGVRYHDMVCMSHAARIAND